jgi:hypothetical protein
MYDDQKRNTGGHVHGVYAYDFALITLKKERPIGRRRADDVRPWRCSER